MAISSESPQVPGEVAVGGLLEVGVVAEGGELGGYGVREGAFEVEAVGEVLVVEAWGVGGPAGC